MPHIRREQYSPIDARIRYVVSLTGHEPGVATIEDTPTTHPNFREAQAALVQRVAVMFEEDERDLFDWGGEHHDDFASAKGAILACDEDTTLDICKN